MKCWILSLLFITCCSIPLLLPDRGGSAACGDRSRSCHLAAGNYSRRHADGLRSAGARVGIWPGIIRAWVLTEGAAGASHQRT